MYIKSFDEKLAHKFLSGLEIEDHHDNATHILTPEELKKIDKIVFILLLKSAIIGALGVILLYFPQYLFPDFFNIINKQVNWFGVDFVLQPIAWTYGIVLAILELYYLSYINVVTVRKLAKVCGFPRPNDPDKDKHLLALALVGLEKEDKNFDTYGLNPYRGISGYRLFLWMIFFRLKATISNILIKVVLVRIMGRYALREIIDQIGIPVFAFWNAWAAYKVVHETKVRIMAPDIIKMYLDKIYPIYKDNTNFVFHVYDVLQWSSEAKRKYHRNHYLLAGQILEKFNIPIKDRHVVTDDFYDKLCQMEDKVAQKGLIDLFVLCMVLDGYFSKEEKKQIMLMNNDGVCPYSPSQVDLMVKTFVSGMGVATFTS